MKNFFHKLWKDESGQGTAEYVLLLVVVVALVFIFRGKITAAIKGQVDKVGTNIETFEGNQ